jgi:hypothetical protein
MNATTMVKELQYQLSDGAVGVSVHLDAEGIATTLSYSIGKRTPLLFRGDEIVTARSDEGTRATVTLETGAADRPIARLMVIVPDVVSGDKASIDVTAAALRTTERSGFGIRTPGPAQSYETLSLKGTVTIAGEAPVTCRDWQATHDLEPGHPKTLTVTGTCTFPMTGFTVKLRRTQPQGISRNDLLLDKIVTPPAGHAGNVVTNVQVRYEEVTDVEYDTVTILPDGPTIPVENRT